MMVMVMCVLCEALAPGLLSPLSKEKEVKGWFPPHPSHKKKKGPKGPFPHKKNIRPAIRKKAHKEGVHA